MADMFRWTFEEAKKLLDDPYSCLEIIRTTKHIPLSPRYIGRLTAGVHAMLKSELKLYSQRFGGVLLAYSNLSCLQSAGTIIGSEPYVHIDVQGDFVVFKPKLGSILRGVINKCGRDFLGCLVHGFFNASIPKYLQDRNRMSEQDFNIGQEFLFKVTLIETKASVLSIRGVLFEESFSQPLPAKSAAKRNGKQSSAEVTNGNESLERQNEEPPEKKKRHKVSPDGSADVNEALELGSTEEVKDSTDSHKRHKKKKAKKHKDKDREIDTEDLNTQNDGDMDSTSVPETMKKKKKKSKRSKETDE